jgi:hypothetical protein
MGGHASRNRDLVQQSALEIEVPGLRLGTELEAPAFEQFAVQPPRPEHSQRLIVELSRTLLDKRN